MSAVLEYSAKSSSTPTANLLTARGEHIPSFWAGVAEEHLADLAALADEVRERRSLHVPVAAQDQQPLALARGGRPPVVQPAPAGRIAEIVGQNDRLGRVDLVNRRRASRHPLHC